ncbi:MAG: prepilin-type N-terminal cleavage/methylation domain-containing protein, partial [Lentisphaeraceae bacterium]|nr:prepilin-type N-terminal cleavage/methylation domain-containing protein [Lentisphaeraceae bacterium]
MKTSYFTLLELLIVAAILALISGGVIVAFSDVEDAARENIGKHQATTIRNAMLKFRQDMGYYPKQKRLAYEHLDLTDAEIIAAGEIAKQAWIEDEENFYQLF